MVEQKTIIKRAELLKKVPQSIWALGFVSMFMDISSDFINSLLPIYMSSVLGISVIYIGLIEGIAEALVLMIKIFSGVLSDIIKKRKIFAVMGYGLSACAKLIFPFASSVGVLLSARVIDRLGKGLRDAPRDALLGELAPASIRGLCFGLRQALDNVGAFIGPIIAMITLAIFTHIGHIDHDFRALFWIAVIPAFLSVLLLIIGVKEPKREQNEEEKKEEGSKNVFLDQANNPVTFSFKVLCNFGPRYWLVVAAATVLMFARFSQAFLVLRSTTVGMPFALAPLVIIIMNVVSAISSYYAGYLSDSINRLFFIIAGFIVLVASDIILGYATNPWHLIGGVILWGLHLGLTQGIFDALIVDTTESHVRGSAFGVFNFICGIAIIISNLVAGFMWMHYSPAVTFFVGAGFTVGALVFFVIKLALNHSRLYKK